MQKMFSLNFRLLWCDNYFLVSFLNTFLASGNEGITKFVRVMLRKQPLECGAQGIDVDVLCLLEIHEGFYLAKHRSERYVSQGDISAHAFFARLAFKGVVVNNFYGRQFALSKSEVEQHE